MAEGDATRKSLWRGIMTRAKDGVPAVECYDRCFPSTIAFASPEEALQFSKEHGGTIVPCQTLTGEAKKP